MSSLLLVLPVASIQQACDISQPAAEVCEDFCTSKCSFFNATAGETGQATNITLYRITPKNVTGIQNKNTGDAPGDVSFFLGRKNITQRCAQDQAAFGCFLEGDNVYGKFTVEIDGKYGPYFECNPINVFNSEADRISAVATPVQYGAYGQPIAGFPTPAWVDTRTFECGQGCLQPTAGDCHDRKQRNGTSSFGGGFDCWCDGTARHNQTVGREAPPFHGGGSPGPAWWVPQCRLGFYEASTPLREQPVRCVKGKALRTVQGWDFPSVTAAACDACTLDTRCNGWRTNDNRTATLLSGRVRPSRGEACIGGVKYVSSWGGSSWGQAGDLGGSWYSTPLTAECAAGQPLGAGGCSWRVVEATYRNASCVDSLVDRAVERRGAVCLGACKQPLNRTGDCYLDCYKNTLLGDAVYNLSAMGREEIVAPWEGGFAPGGCPAVQPSACEGPQCGDHSRPPHRNPMVEMAERIQSTEA